MPHFYSQCVNQWAVSNMKRCPCLVNMIPITSWYNHVSQSPFRMGVSHVMITNTRKVAPRWRTSRDLEGHHFRPRDPIARIPTSAPFCLACQSSLGRMIDTWGRFIRMTSNRCRKSHTTVFRPSFIHNGISHFGTTPFVYRNGAQRGQFHEWFFQGNSNSMEHWCQCNS